MVSWIFLLHAILSMLLYRVPFGLQANRWDLSMHDELVFGQSSMQLLNSTLHIGSAAYLAWQTGLHQLRLTISPTYNMSMCLRDGCLVARQEVCC